MFNFVYDHVFFIQRYIKRHVYYLQSIYCLKSLCICRNCNDNFYLIIRLLIQLATERSGLRPFQIITGSVTNDEHSTPLVVFVCHLSCNASLSIARMDQRRVELAFSEWEPQVVGVNGHQALSCSHVHKLRVFCFLLTCGNVVIASLKVAVSERCNKYVHQHRFGVRWDLAVCRQVISL